MVAVTGEGWSPLAAVVGIFATVGVGLGVTSYVTIDWAVYQFVTAASGAAPQQFGPVFVTATALNVTAGAFVVGLLLAGLAGLLFGSRSFDPRTTAVSVAGGSFVGSVLVGVLAVVGIRLGVSGPAADQVFTLVDATGPIAVTGLLAAVVAAASTYLGRWATE